MELPGGVVNTFTLDGEGKRRRLEDSTGLRNLLWDLENILVETDSGQATVARYTLAPQLYGELVSQRRAGATAFHHFDAVGSTNALTAADASIAAQYLYTAFGQQTLLSGTSANRLTWVGRIGYYRQDGDRYWVRNTIVNPQLGTRLNRDAMARANAYMWCGSNPLRYSDPSGLDAQASCPLGPPEPGPQKPVTLPSRPDVAQQCHDACYKYKTTQHNPIGYAICYGACLQQNVPPTARLCLAECGKKYLIDTPDWWACVALCMAYQTPTPSVQIGDCKLELNVPGRTCTLSCRNCELVCDIASHKLTAVWTIHVRRVTLTLTGDTQGRVEAKCQWPMSLHL